MESLSKLLQGCDKNALVGVVKHLCVRLENHESDPETHAELHSNEVKPIIRKAMLEMKVAEKRQQDKDRSAFTVVVGAGVAAGKPNFQTVEAGGRERASTGLLVVGSDVLSFISTFLSWEKVKLQREWKAPDGSDVFRTINDGVVWSCHISLCSRMVLTSSGCDLHLWNAASGLLKRTFKGHTNDVTSCRFFPDGKTAVSASDDYTLNVWDIASGSPVRTLAGHASLVMCVDVSPDNARILSVSYDHTWKLWNSRTGELQHTEQMGGFSFCGSFSPNGSLLLVGCDSNLRLHDSTTYELQHSLTGHGDTVLSCSFAPDGATILSGSNDNTMKLWSTTTGQCLRTLDGHSEAVISCSFSPSGHGIYSASHDGTNVMWTAATGKVEGVIHADPTTPPLSMCTSSDGKRIVSGHSGGTVRVFSVSGV
jgi:WD40 repeat protein